MSRNDEVRISKDQPAAPEALGPRVASAYSTPRLVTFGRATTLVQGADLHKTYADVGGHGYHN